MKVLKFGGTSMADAQAWKRVLDIAGASGAGTITVVSATSGTTNSLILAAETARTGSLKEAQRISAEIGDKHRKLISSFFALPEVTDRSGSQTCEQHIAALISLLDNYLLGIHTLGELSPKSLDAVSSIGERLSSFLLAECAKAIGIPAVWIDAAEVMKTSSEYGKAAPDMDALFERARRVAHHSANGRYPIMGGFYGSDASGTITTLGRGGSDYSASLIGLALGASAIEIWTDVSGMYTSDPRFVPRAFSIKELSFSEAAELAYFGAKVLHPATIQPAVEKNIPVYVKNTFEPEHPGTRIFSDADADSPVRAIAFKKDITVITVISSRMLLAWGFLAKVFAIFEKHQVSVDLVSTSEVSISMTVDKKTRLDAVQKELEDIASVKIYHNQALISLVGKNMMQSKGVAAKAFDALAEFPIRMISQGSSDINLSVVVENEHAVEAVLALHDTFFPNLPSPVNA
ncbi:MAG: lysine-sensitive aspartokinase 3 [Balneolales bacterium]|nr:lysine-sensitive aspartokinase 3 [Balneolales bacterium]